MDPQSTSRLRTWASDVGVAWQERIWSPLRRRRRCPRLPALLNDPSLAGRPVASELDRILRIIVGRRLSRFVMGDHPARQSVTDFLERGSRQAAAILPYVQPHEAVLEYGGGVGRVGRAIVGHVRRLVSVDANPLMKAYGPSLSPGVEFRNLDELAESPEFDGAYSIAVFFHLPLHRQRQALEYVYRRLKPGGWFLVDLKIGPGTTGPLPDYGMVMTTALDDFRALYEPLFSVKRVPLFNSGFLLRKKGAGGTAVTPSAGRYAINDASIVADVLEGEVVIVNLDNGSYYILQGTASAIWQLLADGRSVPEIAHVLSRRHGADVASIESAVADFVGQLTQEALIVPGEAPQDPPTAIDGRGGDGDGTPFSVPVMYRYTDMEALIQMDPIREYDETGWPRRHRLPTTGQS